MIGFSKRALHCVALIIFALTSAQVQAYELDQWLQTQTVHSTAVLLSNIGPSEAVPFAAAGSVIASPSLEPNYRYHWVRDAALTMDTVLGLYERSSNRSDKSRYLQILSDYVDFSRRNQLTPNLSGDADELGLGEPKFNLDGSAYPGHWGRPQNDGAAIRASTLIRLANLLLKQGRADWVKQKLYDSVLPARTVIKSDLEFVAHHWRDSSFDLWEEVRATHFYTRMVQRRALLEGAMLADRLGDLAAAQEYRAQASVLESEIQRHWDAKNGQITASLEWVEGLTTKSSGLDVAVVLGALHGTVRGAGRDSFYAVTDDRVLATAEKILESFRRGYTINKRDRDWDNQPLGVAIGRYPEDTYSGTNGTPLGNPWFLATSAYAELYYRCAADWEAQGRIRITPANASLFRRLRLFTRLNPEPGEVVESGDPRFYVLMRGLRQAGDDFLRRVRFHADPNGAFSEQFNRENGFMQSAEELTWSHASLLTAAWARGY